MVPCFIGQDGVEVYTNKQMKWGLYARVCVAGFLFLKSQISTIHLLKRESRGMIEETCILDMCQDEGGPFPI